MKGLVRINCLIVVLVIYLLAQQTSTIKVQPKQTDGLKVHSETLVSTDWLAKHINDRDVFVIHVAAGRKHYDDGHLPGARFLSSKEILTTRNGVANELPSVAGWRIREFQTAPLYRRHTNGDRCNDGTVEYRWHFNEV